MRDDARHSAPVKVNQDDIAAFVETVFVGLAGFVPVRALSEKGTFEKNPWSEYHPVAALSNALIRIAPQAAEQQRGLFVVPATTAVPGTARAGDIQETAVLLIDLDEGDIETARDRLVHVLGDPTLEVASGGMTAAGREKVHLYWRLSEIARGSDLERIRALRQLVAEKVGGDPSFKRLTQPVRVPGTIHGKHGVARPVRVLARNERTYALATLEAAATTLPSLVATPAGAKKSSPGSASFSAGELATKQVRAAGVDGITRFEALSKVIGHWLRQRRLDQCSLEDAWTAVRDYNAAMIVPPWDETRLDREFQALLKRDALKDSPRHFELGSASATDRTKPPPRSEDALAATFVDRHEDEVRHVGVWGKWYVWNTHRWTPDETGHVRELVRQVCRDAAGTASSHSEARRIASDKTIASVARIAATDPRLASRPSDWDQHIWLINTPGGIVDLQTGEISRHDPNLLLTQMTTASPGTGCPRWLQFLDEITGGDADVQSYLKRLAGYCLTGLTSEQMFAFLHGSGANGKSVFINTIVAVLGDYAATATNDTFMASRSDRHLTELAGLRAARLVVVPETEAGRSWAEGRIKTVTGGEKIRANFMRQDHFEFTPQFKLIVAGNHRPAFTGVGEAMRRRLHLVPFEVTIAPEKRDTRLPARLLDERDGILGWMLEGCADWRQRGLAAPEAILQAANRYFDEEDVVGQWIEECCVCGPSCRATARRLFETWSAWAQTSGQPVGSQKSLGKVLRERGFADAKIHGMRGWIGIAPRHEPAGQDGGAQ